MHSQTDKPVCIILESIRIRVHYNNQCLSQSLHSLVVVSQHILSGSYFQLVYVTSVFKSCLLYSCIDMAYRHTLKYCCLTRNICRMIIQWFVTHNGQWEFSAEFVMQEFTVCLLFSYIWGHEISFNFCSEMAQKTVCWKVKYERNNAKKNLNEVDCHCVNGSCLMNVFQ